MISRNSLDKIQTGSINAYAKTPDEPAHKTPSWPALHSSAVATEQLTYELTAAPGRTAGIGSALAISRTY